MLDFEDHPVLVKGQWMLENQIHNPYDAMRFWSACGRASGMPQPERTPEPWYLGLDTILGFRFK